MFNFRRRETPWEVVDSKSVEPVPMYYGDDDLDITAVGGVDVRGTYVFNVTRMQKGITPQDAVIFARQQLLMEVEKKGYNALLLESWHLTALRRGKEHRIEVRYSGRPARTLGALPNRDKPPFMALLQTCH